MAEDTNNTSQSRSLVDKINDARMEIGLGLLGFVSRAATVAGLGLTALGGSWTDFVNTVTNLFQTIFEKPPVPRIEIDLPPRVNILQESETEDDSLFDKGGNTIGGGNTSDFDSAPLGFTVFGPEQQQLDNPDSVGFQVSTG